MTRYFYSDPLAAAWMAKHFGMKLEYISEDGLEGAIGSRCLIDCMEWYDRKVKRFFIHPDSLHLLEMHLNDLCVFRGALGNEIIDFYDEHMTFRERAAGALLRIIQRNGIAFMWPESEAA